MKNIKKNTIVALTALAIILNFSNIALSQNYQGGEGGGYDSLPISIGTSVPLTQQTAFDFNVYPNPMRNGQSFKAKIQGVSNNQKIIVTVLDMIGSKIYSEEINAATEVAFNLPTYKLKKGIYLITLQYNHQKVTRRFTYID